MSMALASKSESVDRQIHQNLLLRDPSRSFDSFCQDLQSYFSCFASIHNALEALRLYIYYFYLLLFNVTDKGPEGH